MKPLYSGHPPAEGTLTAERNGRSERFGGTIYVFEGLGGLVAWLGEINEYAQDDVVIMLIGNKADAGSDRVVQYEDGERLAKEYGVTFMETSAKTGVNVELAFMAVARELKYRQSCQADQDSKFNVKEYVRQESTKAKSSGTCCG
ncbi:Ras-related protein Rab-37 [Araneus ventricosus]|uniref:Ras-related protein Rab-37 n=1 Tax=Araneus ventricosus TaxID=182803 RepID=A0A4Y2IC91_ARAVE|nr:Ras-related protein Rab-37 [Araneus ventricosus]